MAFEGYLIKDINNNIFPLYITTYKISPSQEQEVESYVDTNGFLHTETASHRRTKIEITLDDLNSDNISSVLQFFPSMKNTVLTYWNDKSMEYQTGTFYIPNYTLEYEYYTETTIYYKPLSISFIEY